MARRCSSACFLGYDVKHEIFNEGDDELVMLWVISPPGLEHVFRAIGRPRAAGESGPKPFERSSDVVLIERRLGMNDTVAGDTGHLDRRRRAAPGGDGQWAALAAVTESSRHRRFLTQFGSPAG